MRLRSSVAALLFVLVAMLSVRETRCGSECQAAAALFAANAATVNTAAQLAEPMPGMEDCPMAKMHGGDTVAAPEACKQRMLHSSNEAQTEEHARAPEFGVAAVTLDSLMEFRVPAVAVEREGVDVSPPERTEQLASLQSTLRI